jgi:hypothetical protein
MYVETKDLNRMTITFLSFVQNRLIKLIEKDPSLEKNIEKNIQIIDYTLINDSDKPGIIEAAIVKAGERKFKATYWHNDHYRNFVELQGEGGAKK